MAVIKQTSAGRRVARRTIFGQVFSVGQPDVVAQQGKSLVQNLPLAGQCAHGKDIRTIHNNRQAL